MLEIEDDEIDVDELMLSIREASRRKAESIQSSHDSPVQPASSNGSPATQRKAFSLNTELQQRSDARYTMSELLKYYDREFIENAYRAILKREPDHAGLEQYLEHLRNGRSDRIDILARLRFSLEGREKNVQVEGLFWPATIRRFYRIPAIGYIIQWLVELIRLPVLLRNQRQFEAYSQSRQERIVAHINQVSAQLDKVHASIFDHFQKLDEDVKRLAEIQEQRARDLRELLETRAQMLDGKVRALDEKLEERMRASDERSRAALQVLDERLEAQAEQLSIRAEQLNDRDAQLELRAERLEAQLQAEAEQISQRLQATRAGLALQGRRMLMLLDEARPSLSNPAERQPPPVIAEVERHFSDSLYASFEDHFRGSREEITDRLQIYLPLLREAGIITGILDIGAGRGEWLEVLREEGMEGRGVDTNSVQVEACAARKLEVIHTDALDYLRSLPDESLNAVTGFHVIEHLEFGALVSLVDEIVRTLAPGGLVIFETPNPENVSVGTHNFYVDPTHRNPLPIPIMKFLFESRGFSQIEIIRLHPSETPRVEGNTDLIERFNEYFYGPMDYAITGRKVRKA